VLVVSTLFFSLLIACHPPKIDLSKGSRNYTAADYEDVLEKWTRQDKSFEDFDVNLHVQATFWSWDFAWAYAVKHAKLYGLSKQKAAVYRKTLLAEKDTNIAFFAAVVTQEPAWNDLSDKDSIWRVVLEVDGFGSKRSKRQIKPTDIERVSPITSAHRTFFPYLNLFANAYRIRFPRHTADGRAVLGKGANKFTLQIAGPKGKVRLHWKVRGR
jgi:hypothetical protein